MKFIYLNYGMKEINVKKILAVTNATYQHVNVIELQMTDQM